MPEQCSVSKLALVGNLPPATAPAAQQRLPAAPLCFAHLPHVQLTALVACIVLASLTFDASKVEGLLLWVQEHKGQGSVLFLVRLAAPLMPQPMLLFLLLPEGLSSAAGHATLLQPPVRVHAGRCPSPSRSLSLPAPLLHRC